uniref:Transmembrane serine protease 4b n=1 Tax=Cyprinus carpio TaxID=7962 RepID=A0A8C1MQI3_CYPCA
MALKLKRRRELSTLRTEESRARWRLIIITVCCVLVILATLIVGLYFTIKMVKTKFFFCSGSLKFISIEKVCDKKADCAGREDEITCISKLQTNDTHPVFFFFIVVGEDRIVGGVDTEIEHWPWQVSLQWNYQHVCGGALLSRRWIISAAHCFTVQKQELKRWTVVLGQTQVAASRGVSIEMIVVHSYYSRLSNDYDIAMLKLTWPVTVGESILPVCLPPHQLSVKEMLVVTGWGLLKEKGELPSVLQKASVPLIDRSECSKPSVYGSAITPRMLCAGFLEGNIDACQGDSGGPLVYLSSRWHIMGIVSWGVGCARDGKPGVYTDVSQLLNWIYTVMKVCFT